MTIWASKSLFEELVDSDWVVEVIENPNYVIFELKPKGEAKIDILYGSDFDRIQFEQIQSTISACGAEEATIDFSSDPCISVQVERNKLPEDYTE